MTMPTLVRGGRRWQVGMVATALVVMLVLVLLPHYFGPFAVSQFSRVIVFAIAALGLNLITGYAGQISLGHSFFFATGAYVAAYLMVDHGWHYLLTLPVAFGTAFLLGYLFALPALRLEGMYLALVTLGLAMVTPALIRRFDGFTGGSQGISITPIAAPSWSGLADDQWLYYLCLVVAAVTFVAAYNLVKSKVGRAMRAVAENPLAARTMGVNLSFYKSMTFAYGTGFAGAAGALFTFTIGYLAPGSFTLMFAIAMLVAIVVGGLGTLSGAVFGALFIVYTPVYAFEVHEALAGVIYAVLLVCFVFLLPGGITDLLRKVAGRAVTVLAEAPARRDGQPNVR